MSSILRFAITINGNTSVLLEFDGIAKYVCLPVLVNFGIAKTRKEQLDWMIKNRPLKFYHQKFYSSSKLL